jgi:hypothetical protein
MFRTVSSSIIRSLRLHTASGICTVLDSWWWTEKPSETCRELFQNKINLRYCASGCFYYRNILRCTVLQTSRLLTCVGFVRIIDDYQTFLLSANQYQYFLRLSANRREITCCVALRHVGTGKALRVCLIPARHPCNVREARSGSNTHFPHIHTP